jgi:hypothetical protein
MPDPEEMAAELGDFMRDGLAYVEAAVRNDEEGMKAILAHVSPQVLLQVVGLIAELCAIEGAVLGGLVERNGSRDEVVAARDEVLRNLRQQLGQGGVI